MAKRPPKGSALKVLLIRFSAIGDCVIAGHAVNDLRYTYPDAELSWAVEDRCAGVISTSLVRKLVLPRRRWRAKGDLKTLFEQYRWLTSFRKFGFDYGFDLQGHSKTAWCLRLSGAKKRLSVHGTDVVANRLNPVLVDPLLEEVHAVESSRRLVNALLPIEHVRSDFLPGSPQVRNPRLVTLCIGAGHPLKVIPPETLVAVGRTLASEGFEVVYLGGPEDQLDAPAGTTNLAEKTTLEESIDWVRKSAVHIAGDTGTGHIAAAVGTPLVSIWGHMPLDRYYPYGEEVTVLNANGIPADVSVAEIVHAAKRWLP